MAIIIPYRFQAGFSALSMVVSIFLSLSILTTLSLTTQALIKSQKRIEAASEDQFTLQRTSSSFRHLFEALDSSPLPYRFRIHSTGRLSLTDGSANDVMSTQADLLPLEDSQSLTTLRVAMSSSLTIASCATDGEHIFGTACLSFKESNDTSQFKSFVGMGADLVVELVGDVSGRGKCKKFRLGESASMLIPQAPIHSACSLLRLLPIEELSTLYLDSTHELRLLSHTGSRNIENQPIGLKLAAINIESIPGPTQDHSGLLISVNLSPNHHNSLRLFHRLPNTDLYNLTLNPE